MKKYENGKYIDMTQEEMNELKDTAVVVNTAPTMLERLEAIEAVLLEGVLSGD